VQHVYGASGTYVVTVTAANSVETVTGTIEVEVTAPTAVRMNNVGTATAPQPVWLLLAGIALGGLTLMAFRQRRQ
jgi:PKD repeat protein